MRKRTVLISVLAVLFVAIIATVSFRMIHTRGAQIYIFDTPYEKTQYVISDGNVRMYGLRGKIISETDTMFTVEQTGGQHATFVVDKNLLVMEDVRDIPYKEIDATKLEVQRGDSYEPVELDEPFVLNSNRLEDGIYFQNNMDVWHFLAQLDALNFIRPRQSGVEIAGELFEDRIDITQEDNGNHIIYGDDVYETMVTSYSSGQNRYKGYQLIYYKTLSGLTARQNLVDINSLLKAYGYSYKITWNKDNDTYRLVLEE